MVEAERLGSEALGYWYFRLNGCLTTVNFVLHPEGRGSQRTDADVLALRFPGRVERGEDGRPLVDHDPFQESKWVDLVLAEVKAGRCELNGSWSDPSRGILQYVLGAVGILRGNELEAACKTLYDGSQYESDGRRIRLFALGRTRTDSLQKGVVQVEWDDVLGFVWDRFQANAKAKADHSQWDDTGRRLWEESRAKPRDRFIHDLLRTMR